MSVYISYSMLIALGFVCILLCTPRRCLTLASCIVGSPIKLQISSFLHAMQEYCITSFKTYFFPTDKFVFSVHFLLCYFHVIVVAPLRLYIMCMYVYTLQSGDFFTKEGMPKTPFPNGWRGEKGLYSVGFTRRGLLGTSLDAIKIAQDVAEEWRSIYSD